MATETQVYIAESKPQRISLSLTASYAPSWGIWEGLRELVQNWHDGLLSCQNPENREVTESPLEFVDAGNGFRFDACRSGQNVGWCEFLPAERKLVLVNRGVGLGRQVLLLGYSQKAQHQDVIGSFGEGLKVGAVAMLRRGLRLRMLTKAEIWSFELCVDPAFGERVLTVETTCRPESVDLDLDGWPACVAGLQLTDTASVLENVQLEEWNDFSQRFLFLRPPESSVRTEVGRLLLDSKHAGQFYVRGVWINSNDNLSAGVDLFDIRLDRDRAAVLKSSDLEHQVSSMWVRALKYCPQLQGRYYDLLASDKKCSDIMFAELYCDDETCEAIAEAFKQRNGHGVPVSVKDANSTKAAALRAALSTTTVVCTQALLAVLKKGGVRCGLDELLGECESKSRRFVPMAELSDAEMQPLMDACFLAEALDPTAAPLSTVVDVFDTASEWKPDRIVSVAEAFAAGGRLEMDRRALNRNSLDKLLPTHGCLCGDGPHTDKCWCHQSVLACAIHTARVAGDPNRAARFGMERLAARLGMCKDEANGMAKHAALRCPELGAAREEALRSQIIALETTLGEERTTHASALKSLQRRVGEAERELAQTEFKIMDAQDAESKLREEWGPELTRLRQEATQIDAARSAASAARTEADAATREVAFLRRQCSDAQERLKVAEEGASRRSEAAGETEACLRRALVRRRELLQKMMRTDPQGPLISMVDGAELQAAVEEIRTVLREEVQESQCCICVDARVNAVLLPCRHQQFCMTCATAVSTCPTCREPIASRLQVYS